MQALLLAAGMGKRLGGSVNKCLMKINGETLFQRMIKSLNKAGIDKLLVVTGYNAEVLEKELLEQSGSLNISFIRTNDFSVTNNIWSLFLAKDYLCSDDTILLESDLLYETDLITELVNLPYRNVAVVAKFAPWMDGTTVLLDEQKIIQFVSKEQFVARNFDISYKTVNIYKFDKNFCEDIYVPFLHLSIEKFGRNAYYEAVLGMITHLNPGILNAYICNGKWCEIDTREDYENAVEKWNI